MICPRHEEARKVAAIVRQQLKAQGAIGAEEHALTIFPPYRISAPRILPGPLTLPAWPSGRIPYAHGGRVRPGEKWTVRQNELQTPVNTRASNGQVRQFETICPTG